MQLIKPNWAAPAHIQAYSTTRLGGVSEGCFAGLNLGMHVADDPEVVLKNRLLLQNHFPLFPHFIWLNQTHSCDLIKHTDPTTQAINADASWTNLSQRTCVVMTADCLPVLVTDQQGSFVAAIHAGWRGLCDGIIEKSIHHICQEMNVNSDQLLVWLGPCIGPTAFEVGNEVRGEFVQQDALASQAFVAFQDKWLADLHHLAKLRLVQFAGINISESLLCTYSDPSLFYSYRRDGKTGRLATFICIS